MEKYKIKCILLFLALISPLKIAKAQQNPDVVKDIPGYPYKGRMFSGYLEINDPLKRYHYMLIESQQESLRAPLILWLNGGPGCSSMSGFLTEIGPATFPEGSQKLSINEYSWHKLANMLFLESPGNVGFSRIDSELEEELYIDDEITAEENFEALLDFFKKYSHFKSQDFYIAGESYAGVYIPMLAKKVVDYNKGKSSSTKIKFRGILIGNGVATYEIDGRKSLMDFAFTHHLVSYETRMEFNKFCITSFDEQKCNQLEDKIMDLTKGFNRYDLLRECWYPDPELMTEDEINKSYYFNYARWAFPELDSIIKRKRDNKKVSFLDENIKLKDLSIQSSPPCMDDRAPTEFLNRPEVQRSLNVDFIEWSTCSNSVGSRYQRSIHGSLPIYPELIKAGLKIIIFSGDTDLAVPYNGNQKWIDSLEMEIKSPWKSWRHPDDELNIAGYRQIYDGLTFVTFKGTGHMAVQWKARDAFYMLKQYLNDKDF